MTDWTPEQKTAWRKGNWTPEMVLALEQLADEHIENCDGCQERLKIDPSTLAEGEDYYCPIGESLTEEASMAGVEYSWQPNFDPNWHPITEEG